MMRASVSRRLLQSGSIGSPSLFFSSQRSSFIQSNINRVPPPLDLASKAVFSPAFFSSSRRNYRSNNQRKTPDVDSKEDDDSNNNSDSEEKEEAAKKSASQKVFLTGALVFTGTFIVTKFLTVSQDEESGPPAAEIEELRSKEDQISRTIAMSFNSIESAVLPSLPTATTEVMPPTPVDSAPEELEAMDSSSGILYTSSPSSPISRPSSMDCNRRGNRSHYRRSSELEGGFRSEAFDLAKAKSAETLVGLREEFAIPGVTVTLSLHL